jgi:cytochrome P450
MTSPDTDSQHSADTLGEPSLFDPASYADGCPYARLAALRARGPVSWQAEAVDPSLSFPVIEAGWWLHSYDAVREVLKDPDAFSSALGSAVPFDPDPGSLALVQQMLLNMDPPEHSQRRRLISLMFTARRVAELEPKVRAIAASVIDQIAPLGTCDAVADISAVMPMTVIAELIGVPEHAQQLLESSNRMIGAVDASAEDRVVGAMTASIELQTLAIEIAQQKRAHPDDSAMSAYVNGALDDGHGDLVAPSDDEVAWFFMLLAVAGNETVRTATSQAIRTLAEHPDQRDLLVSDLDRYLPGAIEEVLRYRSPVRAMRRTATRPVEIAGTHVDAGAKVVCHFSSALRDEQHFDQPEVFDITRPPPSVQLAFGHGEHYCLGANLARLQLRCILDEIYRRIPDIHPSGDVVWQPTILVEGLLSMPVAFTPQG